MVVELKAKIGIFAVPPPALPLLPPVRNHPHPLPPPPRGRGFLVAFRLPRISSGVIHRKSLQDFGFGKLNHRIAP
jgi:hypothetical protein